MQSIFEVFATQPEQKKTSLSPKGGFESGLISSLRSRCLVWLLLMCLTASGCATTATPRGTAVVGPQRHSPAIPFKLESFNIFMFPDAYQIAGPIGADLGAKNASCRATTIGRRLKAENADVVSLQEAWADSFPDRIEQIAIASQMPRYSYRLPHASPGVCLDAKGQKIRMGPKLMHGGLGYLLSPAVTAPQKIKQQWSMTDPLAGGNEETDGYAIGYCDASGTDAFANKGLIYLPITKKLGAQQLNVHLFMTHMNAAGYSGIKPQQLAAIKAAIENVACHNTDPQRNRWPVILVGDLNVWNRSEPPQGTKNPKESVTQNFAAWDEPAYRNIADNVGYFKMLTQDLQTGCHHAVTDAYVEHRQQHNLGMWDAADPASPLSQSGFNCGDDFYGCSTNDYRFARVDYVIAFTPKENPLWKTKIVHAEHRSDYRNQGTEKKPGCEVRDRGKVIGNERGYLSDHKPLVVDLEFSAH